MAAELHHRDPKWIQAIVGIFPILRAIWRVEIHGLENIPEGPVVLISNHNIGAPVEIFALAYAWEKRFRFKFDHPVYGLGHRFAFRTPGLATLVKKLGTVPAEYASAKKVLESGFPLIIFPGGNSEVCRPYKDRHHVEFSGRRGWVKIAQGAKKRVLPIAVVGSHGINPVLFRSRWLSKFLFLERAFGLKWFPITVSQIFWITVFLWQTWGQIHPSFSASATIAILLLTPLNPIFPAKVRIFFMKPFDVSELSEDEVYKKTVSLIDSKLKEFA
ncbi:MAG: 1-acyl-sn-glycerol-3-phosphate acyltransferase [Bdellovibrionales bacterium]|nr:1-acyl-sn-glycerol-3-phosphate acyltransferase [Bdellovibrionales bacterium]